MKITKIKIDNLKTPEKNVRIHTENQVNEFIRSIKMFGQIRPAVIDENNVIICGNGLVEALKRMGIDTVECYKIDNLSDKQKKKLMIADKKIYSLGIENLDVLTDILQELGDYDVPGFDEEILKSMVSDGEEITEKLSKYGTLDEEEIENIKEAGIRKQEAQEDDEEEELEAPNVVQVAEKSESEGEIESEKYVICPKCGEKIWL